jgi:hypothetical protein
MAYPNNNGPQNGQNRPVTEFYLNVRDPADDGSSTKVGSIKLSAYNEYFVELFTAFKANPELIEEFVKTLVIDIKSATPAGGKSAFLTKIAAA